MFYKTLSCLLLMAHIALSQEVNTVASIPVFPGQSRINGISFSLGNKIFLGLGNHDFSYFSDLWEYNPITSVWTQKQNFPGGARSMAIATVVDGKAYVGLGLNESTEFIDWWQYDEGNDSWSRKVDYPGDARAAAFSFAVQKIAYVGSGRMLNGQPSNQFWAYDPQTNAWARKKDFETTGRYFGVGFGIADAGYAGLGYNPNALSFYNDFWKYDPVANDWIQVADFPAGPRCYGTTFEIYQKGYVAGGMALNGNTRVIQSDIWEYDSEVNAWTHKNNIPQPRSGLMAAATKDRAYLGLGMTGDPNQPSVSYPTSMWSYVPDGALAINTAPEIVCAGTSHTVDYSVTGFPLNTGNSLIIELSDKSGGFSNPIEIGKVETAQAQGSIDVSLPGDLAIGLNYKIRLRSTDPALIGKPVSNPLRISAPDLIISLQKTSTLVTCAGSPADFMVEYSGDVVTPDFEWKKNGVAVGVNSNVFHDVAPVDGDRLTCRVIRKSGCTITEKIAGPLSVGVKDLVTPRISIKSTIDINAICSGATVVFTAEYEHGGSLPKFKWEKNNVVLSETSSVLNTNSLNDDDKLTCILVSDETCLSKSTVESDAIQLNVLPKPPAPIITMEGNTLLSSYKAGPHRWYLNGTVIPGAVNASYTIEQSGVYKVTYIDDCESTSTPFNAIFTGLGEADGREITVFPNPSHGVVTVKGPVGRINISIRNNTGTIMQQIEEWGPEFTVDISELPSGFYSFDLKAGYDRSVRKVVKR